MRLEWRVTLWLAVLLGAAAALTLLGMTWFEQRNLDERSRETARLIARATENSLRVGMLNQAPQDIRRAIRELEAGGQVESVAVYRRDGTVWVSSDGSTVLEASRRQALESCIETDRTVASKGDHTLSVFVPVRATPACPTCDPKPSAVLGAVEVRVDERSFQERFAQGARRSLFLAAVPLLLGIGISIVALRRTILRPLAQVAGAADRIRGGETSVRLPSYRVPELEQVSSTFNDMIARVESQSAVQLESVERLRNDLEGMEEIEALLLSGAGLREVLGRSATDIGRTLEASGVAIGRCGFESLDARWGRPLQVVPRMELGANLGRPISSAGPLDDVHDETPIAWAVAPARRDDRCMAVVGVVWDPPRALDRGRRDLLTSLAGLVAIAVQNTDLLDRLRTKEQSLQGLLRKTLTAQEEERRRLSRELHDETSQVLSALMMNVDLLETQLEARAPSDDGSRARVAAVKALAEEAARNLDKMMLDLRPALLDELGLLAALRWYIAQVGDLWGVEIGFEGGRMGRLPDHIEVAAFRIVQEAVSNCMRHARATEVSVRVWVDGGALHLQVVDDGVGFDVGGVAVRAGAGEAVGLMGMRERAELAGGSLRVESVRGVGTTVSAELPLVDAEKAG